MVRGDLLRREKVHRDVISIRLKPDTLDKLAKLAEQQDQHTSRNMLIESIIEGYVRAAFPAQEPEEAAEPSDAPETAEVAPEEKSAEE